jgi:hypothetical protein
MRIGDHAKSRVLDGLRGKLALVFQAAGGSVPTLGRCLERRFFMTSRPNDTRPWSEVSTYPGPEDSSRRKPGRCALSIIPKCSHQVIEGNRGNVDGL